MKHFLFTFLIILSCLVSQCCHYKRRADSAERLLNDYRATSVEAADKIWELRHTIEEQNSQITTQRTAIERLMNR